MRRRQILASPTQPKQTKAPEKKKILVIEYDSMYSACLEKGACVICGQKVKTGIYFHFNSHWNRIREHISANEKPNR
jgi:hypothetical protein